MNDIVYIDHMKIVEGPGVAILDMQMSKVPILSGYGFVHVFALSTICLCACTVVIMYPSCPFTT